MMTPKLSSRKARRGFSLVEVMIAVGVVALGAMSTMTLLSFANLHNYLEMERTRAHQMVSGQIEDLRAKFLRGQGSPIELQKFFTEFGNPNRAVMIWDNGTTDTGDDTEGIMHIRAMNAVTGEAMMTTTTQTRTLIEVEATMEWTPRGRVGGGGTHTYRETAMTYLASGFPPTPTPTPLP